MDLVSERPFFSFISPHTDRFMNFSLVVKLGTITEDLSTADCYSYAKDEDGPVQIPNLKDLLEKRGIMVTGM